MLDRAATLARQGRRLLRPLMVGLFLNGAGIAVLVFNPGLDSLQAALPALIALFLWGVCAWVFLFAFATVPAPVSAEHSALQRIVRRFNRALHWLLLLAFAGITVTAIIASARLITEVAS